MKRLAVAAFAFVLAANAEQRRPVLLELFTSEGCSSCPPADALLEELDKTQPVAGTEILVLSEHVDYWDQIGWRDRFSSPLFTARQRSYGDRFHLDEVYTPQIVVDGSAEVLGSDKGAVLRAVKQAGPADKVVVSLTALPNARAAVKIDPLPASLKGDATVFVALADVEDTSDIRSGENKGRRLHHVSVVRSLTAVGKVTAKDGFTKELALGDHPEHMRLIAFVQEAKQGRILGSAMLAR
jgi:hypothetical protein